MACGETKLIAYACAMLASSGCSLVLDFNAAVPCDTAADCATDYRCHLGICAPPGLEQCGDQVVDAAEECDDGNDTAGDGCEADCAWTMCGGDICGGVHANAACVANECSLTCAYGYLDCDGDTTPGCEQSANDPDHCGACGHSCPGACEEGYCVLTATTDNDDSAWSLAADDSNIYVLTQGTLGFSAPNDVWVRDHDGGSATKVYTCDQRCSDISVTASSVVGAQFYDERVISIAKGSWAETIPIPAIPDATRVAAGPGSSFAVGTQSGEIRTWDGSEHPIATGQGAVEKLAISDGRVFWLTFSNGLKSAPFAGGTVLTHVQPFEYGRALSVDDEYIYWASSSNVLRMPKTSTNNADIETVADEEFITVMAHHDDYVYWCGAQKVLRRYSKDTGEVVDLVRGVSMSELVTGGPYLFFAGTVGPPFSYVVGRILR